MNTSDLFLRLPYRAQDLLVTAYDYKSYKQRRSGGYSRWRDYLVHWDRASQAEIEEESRRRLAKFLEYASTSSAWYRDRSGPRLSDFPVLEKRNLLDSLDLVTTTTPRTKRIVSRTGGTTGSSMKVYYLESDIQERAAFLDHFRASHGYELGARIAWFSGKFIASQKDAISGRCYRDDFNHRIRYFSTFHISARTAEKYWTALTDFSPEFISGFPSSVYGLCVMASELGLPRITSPKAFFPTAETMLPEHRVLIGEMLGCEVRDQYASSEGAPFIFECSSGMLHMHPLSGVFEVVDEKLRPSREGELLVTSFSTCGTPLIRYRIGDRVRLADEGVKCECGLSHQIVEKIDGRTIDFIYSKERGKINLGNLSNSSKNVEGILSFQVVQRELGSIDVFVVPSRYFNEIQESKFHAALRDRVGDDMIINITLVKEISVERSGKFRIVKNLLPPESTT